MKLTVRKIIVIQIVGLSLGWATFILSVVKPPAAEHRHVVMSGDVSASSSPIIRPTGKSGKKRSACRVKHPIGHALPSRSRLLNV